MKWKYLSRLFIIILTTLLWHSVYAQDIHFTNYDLIPTQFNPALTGAYEGNMRAGLIYRDQYRPNNVQPFTTGGLFLDSPIMYGFSKKHWVGVGATLFYDKSGASPQTWSGFYPSVSYHIGLDKRFKNVFTLGAQYGFANRGYDDSKAVFGDEIATGAGGSPDRNRIADFTGGFGDFNLGILFRSRIDKQSVLEMGISIAHLLNPKLTFDQGSSAAIGRRLNAHVKWRKTAGKKMIWEPALWASVMPSALNIMAQLRSEYYFDSTYEKGMIIGLGYRLGDSAQLLLGGIYKDWKVLLSYDQGFNDIFGSAFELGATRRILFNKKPDPTPVIFCPRI